MRPHAWILGSIALMCVLLPRSSTAQIPTPPEGRDALGQTYTGRSYSPYADRDFASGVYWGDTHLHTAFSMDAGAFGNRLGLDEAYRFARGEQVTTSTGQQARLSRPLDFLVISDHSDGMGFFPDLFAGKEHILNDPTGKDWYDRIQAGDGVGVALELIGMFSQGEMPEALVYSPDSAPYHSAWDATVKAAERYDAPGQFTAFIGYEWTSLVRGNNMHRVVVYRDGRDKGGQMVPFTTYPPEGSTNPRDLWKWMEDYEERTKGRVLAIPHNGRLDESGQTREKVYDVAWSGDRKIGRNGKLPAVGNTVDVEHDNWTNTIGASELGTVWTDPEFDPAQKAFYYARVIEIPTPRWSEYDAYRLGSVLPEATRTTTQERAYTSPIWYSPAR